MLIRSLAKFLSCPAGGWCFRIVQSRQIASCAEERSLVFRQLLERVTSTYTYILGCRETKEAVIIDPVIDTVDRDFKLIKELGLNLIYAANTHVHADHVTGMGELKKRLPAILSVAVEPKAMGDIHVKHGETLKFGRKELEVRSTPGHTDACVTFVLHEDRMAFTGDALLIRGCGRTDFQQGNPATLFDSVKTQILSLPKDYLLYPGHDYKGFTVSSVEEEQKYNPRLTQTKNDFIQTMDNLNLQVPKQIERALPANLVCGVFELMDEETRKAIEDAMKDVVEVYDHGIRDSMQYE